MIDLLKKAVSLGFGAAIVSKEKIEQVVDELVARGELGQSESRELVDSLLAKGEEQRNNITRIVQDQVKKVLNELDIATKQDLRDMEERLKASWAAAVPGGLTDPQASAGVPSTTPPTTSTESSLSTDKPTNALQPPIDPTKYV
jgi:polyhydroxyalkanoate synthesis regulator phasin